LLIPTQKTHTYNSTLAQFPSHKPTLTAPSRKTLAVMPADTQAD